MTVTCQAPRCDHNAIWGVKLSGETGSYKVCPKHHAMIQKMYEKVSGVKPQSVLLSTL